MNAQEQRLGIHITSHELAQARRILVVEDEPVVAMVIENLLADEGWSAVGPAASVDAAMRLAREEDIDAAILDVSVVGGAVYPVAELLSERGVPFVLATAYDDWALPAAM